MVQETTKKENTNEVFIGNKPFMKYVIATLMQLDENPTAVIKARGKFISRGVDVAEVARKKLRETKDIELRNSVRIGTERFQNEEGKDINVSIIEIELTK